MRLAIAIAVLAVSATALSAQDSQRNHRPPPIDWSRAEAAQCAAGEMSACRKGYDAYKEMASAEERMILDLQHRCGRDRSSCSAFVQAVNHAINSKGTGAS